MLSCLNARSLANKSTALVDMFNATDMCILLITETWLTNSRATEQRTEDLQYGENIELLRRTGMVGEEVE